MNFNELVRHCYRTIGDVRWPNLCDVLSDRDEADIAARRAAGQRIKMRRHPDGYNQAFIHPEDIKKSHQP